MAETISITGLDETEALLARQAVETFRALRHAVATAPHGKGLATVESVVRDKGFRQLAEMYQSAVREHPEAQKRGSAPGAVAVGKVPHSGDRRPSTCSAPSVR